MERPIELAGFREQEPGLARQRSRWDRLRTKPEPRAAGHAPTRTRRERPAGELPARRTNDHARVEPRVRKHATEHRRCRALPVRPRDRDPRPTAHTASQRLCVGKDREPAFHRGNMLRVIRADRRRDNHPIDVDRQSNARLVKVDRDPGLVEAPGHIARGHVRAAHRRAILGQHPRERRHPAPTDANQKRPRQPDRHAHRPNHSPVPVRPEPVRQKFVRSVCHTPDIGHHRRGPTTNRPDPGAYPSCPPRGSDRGHRREPQLRARSPRPEAIAWRSPAPRSRPSSPPEAHRAPRPASAGCTEIR